MAVAARINNHAGLIWAIADLLRGDQANSVDNFRLVFADAFMKTIVHRMDDNADIFQRILDDREFQSVVMDHYLLRVFERARTEPPAGP